MPRKPPRRRGRADPAGLSHQPRRARPRSRSRRTAGSARCRDPSCATARCASRNWSRRREAPPGVSKQLVAGDRDARRELRKSVLSAFRSFRPVAEPWFDGKRGKFRGRGIARARRRNRAKHCWKNWTARARPWTQARQLPIGEVLPLRPAVVLAAVVAGVHLWLALRAGGGGLAGRAALVR